MLQVEVNRSWLRLTCCFLLVSLCPLGGAETKGPVANPRSAPQPQFGEADDWEWGSGSSALHEFLHSFPADSPFVTETPGKPANCTQRYWLPPSSPVCWDNIAKPEEFAKTRLLVLQNRAALQAVSTSSGVEDGGVSYEQQARNEVNGILSDHQNMAETLSTMEKVFLSLEDNRREGKEQQLLSSIKEKIAITRYSIDGREHMATLLEKQFSKLENSMFKLQQQLHKIIAVMLPS